MYDPPLCSRDMDMLKDMENYKYELEAAREKLSDVGRNYLPVKSYKVERLRGGADDPVPGPSKAKDEKPKVTLIMKLASGAVQVIPAEGESEDSITPTDSEHSTLDGEAAEARKRAQLPLLRRG